MVIDYTKLYSKNEGWFSQKLATNLLSFLKNNNYRVSSVLDVACGTGEFASVMRNGCLDVTGIDFEKAFINVAKKQVKDVNFYVEPLFDFNLNRTFDLVSCNYETVNFANSIRQLNLLFSNIAKHLNKNGIFVFDFKTVKADLVQNIVFEEHTEYDWIKKYSYDGLNYLKHEVIYLATKDNYRRIMNDEVRTLWHVSDVEKALADNGFYNINFIDIDFNVLKKPKKQKHVHVICYKK